MKTVCLREGDVYVSSGDTLPEIELTEEAVRFEVGKGITAVAQTAGMVLPEGEWVGVRAAWSRLSPAEYRSVVKGAELLHFASIHRYCGRCGASAERSGPISFRCPECGYEVFPQLSPAIIVLVRRGDEALLVHARSFRGNFYGLVAGFVETGESLEECVAREVAEETSLRISNVRYRGSQSWPFPSQLMLGFTADYAGGEVKFADGELSAGGFFRRDNIPEIPSYPSIARQLIDLWLDNRL